MSQDRDTVAVSGPELRTAEEKMRAQGQHEEAIAAFADAYRRLTSGQATMLPSSELEPAHDVPRLDDLPAEAAEEALAGVAVIKLNGGLATTMGLQGPKSLVEARDGRTFLDIIIGQLEALRRRHQARLPLVLMNSEATEEATREALATRTGATGPDAFEFTQSMIPKLDAESLGPVSYGRAPALEWCPPGHGDVYGALRRSGMLERLLEDGFRHAMISNSDNLGATLDARIPSFLQREKVPFLMEVVHGTEADRKGGHIAQRRSDGQLVLREVAQTPEEDSASFRDFRRWRYYNTNNLWVDLEALGHLLEENRGVMRLPVIVNRKTVDPRDSSSPAVIQLESAMGAAIGSFAGARLLEVPRTRFVPVKTTDDLLVLRSDVYSVTDDLVVEPVPERAEKLPYVELASAYYKLLDDFETRFPAGAPSLREAERLVVRGDVTFGPGVTVRGSVELGEDSPRHVEQTVLEG